MSRQIVSQDPWQAGYTYELSAPIGEDFDPNFSPDLSPAEMLKLGVFEGAYFADTSEFPTDWFAGIAEPRGNFFGVTASQPLAVWQAKGWIHPDDPRGWFQWYCRYYLGRRSPLEDARQIKRWRAMRRHVAQLQKNCRKGDMQCRLRQRQALLQWAYDSRKI